MNTTPSHRIDGKLIAADVRTAVAKEVAALKQSHGTVPGLAVVLVGEDPASQIYVRNKGKQTTETGMRSIEHKLLPIPAKPTCWRSSKRSIRTRTCMVSWCSCRCRTTSMKSW